MNYFAIQCFPDTYNLVREGPNITPHVTDLMVRAKKILGHEGRCADNTHHFDICIFPNSLDHICDWDTSDHTYHPASQLDTCTVPSLGHTWPHCDRDTCIHRRGPICQGDTTLNSLCLRIHDHSRICWERHRIHVGTRV